MLDPCVETREEFERRYRVIFPRAVFGQTHLSLECTCEDGGGPTHWAAIGNTPEMIRFHRSHEECLAELRRDYEDEVEKGAKEKVEVVQVQPGDNDSDDDGADDKSNSKGAGPRIKPKGK